MGVVLLVLVLALLGRLGGRWIEREERDFKYFYCAGQWLWERGALDPGYDVGPTGVTPRGRLDWYWPCVARFMTLLGWLPFRPAGYIWLGLNLVALTATLRLLGRHFSGLDPRDWAVTQILPLVLLALYWRWEFRLNQIDNFTLLFLVGSFATWQMGRRGIAGFWLGLAVLLKLTPMLLVIWFGLKREWRTVGAAVLTIVLAGPVSDVIALRPDLALDAYRGWWRTAVLEGSTRALILSERERDWRNQGVGAVLARWLHPTNYNTRFDNDPVSQSLVTSHEVRTLNVVDLPRPVVANLALAVSAASGLALLWLARHPARELSPWQLRCEWALFLLGMLWLMPVLRRYHLILLMPAVSLLLALAAGAGWRTGFARLAVAAVAAAGLAQLSALSMRAEASGLMLASVAGLAVPLVAAQRRLARDPAAFPPPQGLPAAAPAAPSRAPSPNLTSPAPSRALRVAAHAPGGAGPAAGARA